MAKVKKLEKSDSAIASKKSAAEKRRAKASEIATMLRGGGEPTINPLEYRLSLAQCTNWYNLNTEPKDMRSYLNEYLISTNRKKLVSQLNQFADYEIRSLGLLCRLKSRGEYLEEVHDQYIEKRIADLVGKIPVQQVVEPKKATKPKDLTSSHYDVFEGAIDQFVKTKKTDLDVVGYLKSNEIQSVVAKDIGLYYKDVLGELEQAQTNLEEYGYGNWKKTQFKKFVDFVRSIVDACNQQTLSAKVRKPRKKRAVNPAKVVAKVKYMKEFVELNLKSVKPESMVDSSEIWVYNTKYRKLAVYKAEKGSKLSIKGTTILGFDIKESSQVMLRKPDEFFKNTQLAKRALANGMKGVNTRPVTPNGRLNEEIVLLGVF